PLAVYPPVPIRATRQRPARRQTTTSPPAAASSGVSCRSSQARSPQVVTSVVPSGENATAVTGSPPARSRCWPCSPDATSISTTRFGLLPSSSATAAASVLPSGLNARALIVLLPSPPRIFVRRSSLNV